MAWSARSLSSIKAATCSPKQWNAIMSKIENNDAKLAAEMARVAARDNRSPEDLRVALHRVSKIMAEREPVSFATEPSHEEMQQWMAEHSSRFHARRAERQAAKPASADETLKECPKGENAVSLSPPASEGTFCQPSPENGQDDSLLPFAENSNNGPKEHGESHFVQTTFSRWRKHSSYEDDDMGGTPELSLAAKAPSSVSDASSSSNQFDPSIPSEELAEICRLTDLEFNLVFYLDGEAILVRLPKGETGLDLGAGPLELISSDIYTDLHRIVGLNLDAFEALLDSIPQADDQG